MTTFLDHWHKGQFFMGKETFNTSKKIQVLTLSGFDSQKGEFVLYHMKSPESGFEPIVSSQPFEITLPRKNQKISFQTKKENGNYQLYLNGQKVYFHPIHLNKLYLSHQTPAILHDATFYEVSADFAKSYNSTHHSTSSPISNSIDLVSQILSQSNLVQEEIITHPIQENHKEPSPEEPSHEKTVEETTHVEPSHEEPSHEETFEEITHVEPSPEEPFHEETFEETTHVEPSHEETEVKTSHKETSFEETVEEITHEEPSLEETKVETSHIEPSLEETKVETSHIEPSLEETKVETSHEEPSFEETEVETSHEETKVETSHVETRYEETEVEITHEETKVETSHVETRYEEPSHEETVEESSVIELVKSEEEEKMKKHVSFVENKKDSYESRFENIMKDFKKMEQENKQVTIHSIEFQHQNKNFKLPCLKLKYSAYIDFENISVNPVFGTNMIQKPNFAMVIPEMNKYYLVQHMNIKYLFYRNPQMLIITQLHNRQSRVVKNKDIFKLGPFDYLLTNQASMIVPMEQKKYFDNHYGTTFQTFMPRV